MRYHLPKLKAVHPAIGSLAVCVALLHSAQWACPEVAAQDSDTSPQGVFTRAESEWHHGQRRRAVDIMTDLLRRHDLDNDTRAQALNARCWYHWYLDEKDQALRDVTAACAIDSSPVQSANIHMSAANVEVALGMYREAEHDASLALKSGGLDTQTRVDEANSIISKTQNMREQQAATPAGGNVSESASKASADKPVDVEQAIQLAQKLANEQKFPDALDIINRLFASQSASEASCIKALFIRAAIYLQESKYQPAIPDYDRILISKLARQGTWRTEALIGRGQAKFRLGQTQQALKDLTEASAQAASLPQLEQANLAAMIGFASYASGDLKTASQHFTSALNLEPQSSFAPMCALYKARCDRKMHGDDVEPSKTQPQLPAHQAAAEKPAVTAEKKPEVAADKKGIAKQPEPALPAVGAAVKPTTTGALSMDSMLAQQVKDYDSLLQLNSNDRDALYDRGIALMSLGKNVQAAGDFQKCLMLAPPNSVAATQARLFLAVARLLSADRHGALSTVQPALAGQLSSQWPTPVFQFVAGKITADQLFSLAQTQSEQTTARYTAAMVALASGQSANAAKEVQWVIAHGDKRMDEYFLSVSAQRQLRQQPGTPRPGKRANR
ncbi:MAG TPA: hypothetical protein V6D22_09315 [Candidatus Obscuribacterales bacterium]